MRSVAYSMMCFITGKFTRGSPPWNSMVRKGEVVCSARSTAFVAVSTDMSVCTASMLAREAWQYTQVSLQRRVTTMMWRFGPTPRKLLRRRSRSTAAGTSNSARMKFPSLSFWCSAEPPVTVPSAKALNSSAESVAKSPWALVMTKLPATSR